MPDWILASRSQHMQRRADLESHPPVQGDGALPRGESAVRPLNGGRSSLLVFLVLTVLLALVLFGSFLVGRFPITPSETLRVLSSAIFSTDSGQPQVTEAVVLTVRMPRIFAAVLVGGALAVAGSVFQGLFRNPMVSPDILGASSGAGFGAAIAILASFSAVGIQFSAFAFGLAAVLMAYWISRAVSFGNDSLLILVLSGMVISSLFSSFITLAKYVADPFTKLPEITYWLMGSLATASLADVQMLLVPLGIGLVPLFLLRWRLNALAFGDEEAMAMGLNPRLLRAVFIFSATMLAASCVAVAGLIGWVGLIIPHLARMIVGPNFARLIPASFLIGGIFLLVVDDIARTAFTVDLPLGILTSVVGAPFFVFLLVKRRRSRQ